MNRPLLIAPERLRDATLRWINAIIWGANAAIAALLGVLLWQ